MENKKKNSFEKIFGICSYSINGGAIAIFYDLLTSLGINKLLIHEELKGSFKNASGISFLSFSTISKSPATWFNFLLKYYQTTLTIYKSTREYNMVIANDFVSLIYILPNKLFKKLDVYYFCHGAFRSTWFNRNILSWFINYSTNIVVVSSLYLKRDLIEMGVKSKKIHLIYNGIQEPKIIEQSVDDCQSGVIKMCTVGQIQFQKGQDLFIEAIHNLNSKGYKIIGTIIGQIVEGNFYEALKKQSSLATEKNIIVFRSEPEHQKVMELMSTQDAIICLSRYRETLPTVLLEAMALKKAIIGTKVGGIPEVIDNSENGYLIDPNNVSQLEEAILKLTDLDCSTRFGEKGYQIFKTKFNRETFLEQHRLLIEKQITYQITKTNRK